MQSPIARGSRRDHPNRFVSRAASGSAAGGIVRLSALNRFIRNEPVSAGYREAIQISKSRKVPVSTKSDLSELDYSARALGVRLGDRQGACARILPVQTQARPIFTSRGVSPHPAGAFSAGPRPISAGRKGGCALSSAGGASWAVPGSSCRRRSLRLPRQPLNVGYFDVFIRRDPTISRAGEKPEWRQSMRTMSPASLEGISTGSLSPGRTPRSRMIPIFQLVE